MSEKSGFSLIPVKLVLTVTGEKLISRVDLIIPSNVNTTRGEDMAGLLLLPGGMKIRVKHLKGEIFLPLIFHYLFFLSQALLSASIAPTPLLAGGSGCQV